MKKYIVDAGEKTIECNGDDDLVGLMGTVREKVHPLMIERVEVGQSFVMNFSAKSGMTPVNVKRVQ